MKWMKRLGSGSVAVLVASTALCASGCSSPDVISEAAIVSIRETEAINGLAFVGTRLVVALRDGAVIDLGESGRVPGVTLTVFPEELRVLQCSADGRVLLAADRTQLRLIDVPSRRVTHVFDCDGKARDDAEFVGATISDDARRVGALMLVPNTETLENSSNGWARIVLRVFEVAAKTEVFRSAASVEATAVAFSPTGSLICDSALTIWAVREGSVVASGRLGAGRVAFACHGSRLVWAAPDGNVRVFDSTSLREVLRARAGAVITVHLDRWLIGAIGNELHVRDLLDDGRLVQRVRLPSRARVIALASSPAGRVAVAVEGGSAFVYSAVREE